MSRELEKIRDAFLPVEQTDRDAGRLQAWIPRTSGFFSFRYSSTEIYSEGGNLHVRMKETRYQDGRFKSEECEGTLDRQAYNRAVNEAQGYFLNQMSNFMRMLYLPFSGRGRPYDE